MQKRAAKFNKLQTPLNVVEVFFIARFVLLRWEYYIMLHYKLEAEFGNELAFGRELQQMWRAMLESREDAEERGSSFVS